MRKCTKLFIIVMISVLFLLNLSCTINSTSSKEFWHENYFSQTNVITPSKSDTTIKAKINEKWKNYTLQQFPKKIYGVEC